MHKRYGFTVVELVIVVIIVGILISIGAISFRATRVDARNKERETDVQMIANYLESIYSREFSEGGSVIKHAGAYPQRDILHPANASKFDIVFSEVQKSALYSPSSSTTRALIPNNNPSTAAGINTSNVTPQNSDSSYIYVPLNGEGSNTCTVADNRCRMFQIYYKLEGESGYRMLESKRK